MGIAMNDGERPSWSRKTRQAFSKIEKWSASRPVVCTAVLALNALFLCLPSPFFNDITSSTLYIRSALNDTISQSWALFNQTVSMTGGGHAPGGPAERPKEFVGCGTWQEDYIKLHEDILAGRRPRRYVVSVGVEEGLADRITGCVSEFYFALLTGRAFQITSGNQPPFEWAYDAPYINWTRPNDDDKLVRPLNNRVILAGQGLHWDADVNMTKYGFVNWYNGETIFEWEDFYVKDFNNYPEGHGDSEIIFISSNRGRTYLMFTNPFHREQLRKWGLRPETAFACAFNFLFRPRPESVATTAPELAVVQADPTALKIGVNIRVGDYVFSGDNVGIEVADRYISCAEEVEKRAQPGQKVLWYVLSDSLMLRKLLKEKYGEKIITNTGTRVIHPNCHIFGEAACGDQGNAQMAGLQFAAGQLYAFSHTDIQILTMNSGFGRLGAWMSAAQNGYNHTLVFYDIGEPRSCSITENTRLEDSARTWSGV